MVAVTGRGARQRGAAAPRRPRRGEGSGTPQSTTLLAIPSTQLDPRLSPDIRARLAAYPRFIRRYNSIMVLMTQPSRYQAGSWWDAIYQQVSWAGRPRSGGACISIDTSARAWGWAAWDRILPWMTLPEGM